LLHGDKAIAAWRQSNCCMAMQQSTSQEESGFCKLDKAASHRKFNKKMPISSKEMGIFKGAVTLR